MASKVPMDKEILEKRFQVSKRVTKSIYTVGRNQGKRNSKCQAGLCLVDLRNIKEVRKVIVSHIKQSLVGHCKDFAFYSE